MFSVLVASGAVFVQFTLNLHLIFTSPWAVRLGLESLIILRACSFQINDSEWSDQLPMR